MRLVAHLRWVDEDQYRPLLAVVFGGAMVAGALAIVGLPPFGLHGPQHSVGIMDPLCGMTRAVRAFARGDLTTAWRFNPASFVLAGFAAFILARAAIGWVTSRWLELSVARPRVLYVAALVGIGVLEVNQQLQSARLA